MARRTETIHSTGTETVVGAGVTLRGDLRSDGDILIDGRLEGRIETEGNLSIGVNAVVFGPVSGMNVSIAGRVEGPVGAAGEVAITSTGQVLGDIACNTLSVESGGVFLGRSQMPTTAVQRDDLKPKSAPADPLED